MATSVLLGTRSDADEPRTKNLYMTTAARRTHVFVVRMWEEPRGIGDGPAVWRGSAEQATDQKQIYFDRFSVLTSFLVESTGATAMMRDRNGN